MRMDHSVYDQATSQAFRAIIEKHTVDSRFGLLIEKDNYLYLVNDLLQFFKNSQMAQDAKHRFDRARQSQGPSLNPRT